jgi:hypothetical protein
MSRNASLPKRIRTSDADPKSLENYPRKLDVRELSSARGTVLCVWKPVALAVTARARASRVTHYGALEQPSQRKAEGVKRKDESAWHQYNSLIVHDVRRSAIRNLVNAGAFQGELLCGLQAAKRERCFAVATLFNRRRDRSHGTSGNSRTAAAQLGQRDSAKLLQNQPRR